MKKFWTPRAFAALIVAIAFVSLGASSASADGVLAISANPWPPVAGQDVSITGTAQFTAANEQCVGWTLTFDGQTFSGDASSVQRSGNTETFSHTWRVPAGNGGHTASATCTQGHSLGYGQIVLDPVLDSQVLHSGGSSHGLLPNTGGPDFWWLVAAIAFLIAGGVVAGTSRRRQSES